MRIACLILLFWGIFSSLLSSETPLVIASEVPDDFESYMAEHGDDSESKSHGPHIHNTTWAIAATTPRRESTYSFLCRPH